MSAPTFRHAANREEAGTLIPVTAGVSLRVLRIPAHTVIDTGIEYAVTEGEHLMIVAEEDSSATVTLIVRSSYCAVEVIARENASLTMLCLQESPGQIVQRSSIAADASVHFQNVTLSDRTQHHLLSEVTGPNAMSTIDWIFYARSNDDQHISARNVFSAREGGGEITMKGVAEGSAHIRCDGCIAIGPHGNGTETFLREDVLMLDKTAKVDAVPGLEIKTNDVRASHAAAVSKVTPDDLFYFASRGIDEHNARHMYVLGFLSDLTERIADSALRERIRGAIAAKYDR